MTPQEINSYLAKELMHLEVVVSDKAIMIRHDGLSTWIKWNPYKDITQALGDGGSGTVVGAMKAGEWELALDNEDVGFLEQGWRAEFLLRPGSQIIQDSDCHADTPAAAICLAAVEALKAEKKL